MLVSHQPLLATLMMWLFLGNPVLQCHQHISNSWQDTWVLKTQPVGFSEEKNSIPKDKLVSWGHHIHDGATRTKGSWLPAQISLHLSLFPFCVHAWCPFSPVQLFATLWTAARQVSLSFTISRSLLSGVHLILFHTLLLLPSIFPSIRVFSSESTLPIRWPKYWSFNSSNSPSNDYSGLISFRTDWFDLLNVQGILKRLLQRNWKASIFLCSAFFMIQLPHPYMNTRKNIAFGFNYTAICQQRGLSAF